MEITLTPEQTALVEKLAAAGGYPSAAAALEAALRLLAAYQQRQAELKQAIQEGIDQLERGEAILCRDEAELTEFFEGIKQEGRQRRQAKERLAG